MASLRPLEFDYDYASSGGLRFADLEHVVKKLVSLSDYDYMLSYDGHEKVLSAFLHFLTDKEFKHPPPEPSWLEQCLSMPSSKEKQLTPREEEAQRVQHYIRAFFQRVLPPSCREKPPSALEDLFAFQTAVSAVYNHAIKGFRTYTSLPNTPLAPLATWGSDDRIQARPLKDMPEEFRSMIGAGLVALPANFRAGGLLPWLVLSHEVGGHSALDSCPKLLSALSSCIEEAVQAFLDENYGTPDKRWVKYWSNLDCIEELASDLLGILVSGPSFAIGLVAYFRGKNHGRLDFSGDFGSPHPPDILRVLAAVKAINLCHPLSPWLPLLMKELQEELDSKPPLLFSGRSLGRPPDEISFEFAKQTIECVAETILTTRIPSLGDKSLIELLHWNTTDDFIVEKIKIALESGNPNPPHASALISENRTDIASIDLARYIIPAALSACIKGDSDVPSIFEKVKTYLTIARNRETPRQESAFSS